MTATVEEQGMQDVANRRLLSCYRAVCFDHPVTEYLIPPWMGDPQDPEDDPLAYYVALTQASAHNHVEHPGEPDELA